MTSVMAEKYAEHTNFPHKVFINTRFGPSILSAFISSSPTSVWIYFRTPSQAAAALKIKGQLYKQARPLCCRLMAAKGSLIDLHHPRPLWRKRPWVTKALTWRMGPRATRKEPTLRQCRLLPSVNGTTFLQERLFPGRFPRTMTSAQFELE